MANQLSACSAGTLSATNYYMFYLNIYKTDSVQGKITELSAGQIQLVENWLNMLNKAKSS